MGQINPSAIYYILSAGALVGGLFVKWLAARDKDQEERFNAKLTIITDAHDKLEDTLNLRLAAMKAENRDAGTALASIQRDYISRSDHQEFRSELLAAVKDIGAQVAHSLDGFRLSMEKLVDRVSEVERMAGR